VASKLRTKLLASAVKCFGRKGFAGCSTKEIAEHAGIPEGSLFRIFSSKENLFEHAIEQTVARFAKSGYLKEFESRLMAFGILERPSSVRSVVKKHRLNLKPAIVLPGFHKSK
jgi:AcrR family transcriptional regulator